jgi:hypothetical protein
MNRSPLSAVPTRRGRQLLRAFLAFSAASAKRSAALPASVIPDAAEAAPRPAATMPQHPLRPPHFALRAGRAASVSVRPATVAGR